MQQMSQTQAEHEGVENEHSHAETEHRRCRRTLGEFLFDLPPRRLELLFDEVLEIAENATHQRCGGLLRLIFDFGGHRSTPQ
ncbi:MAG: hypothetical protein AABP62_23885 [Planctomycetota bacterium]